MQVRAIKTKNQVKVSQEFCIHSAAKSHQRSGAVGNSARCGDIYGANVRKNLTHKALMPGLFCKAEVRARLFRKRNQSVREKCNVHVERCLR